MVRVIVTAVAGVIAMLALHLLTAIVTSVLIEGVVSAQHCSFQS